MGKEFSQYKLTQNLLNNLQQFNVSPLAKLVLLEISACYNPATNVMYPKQASIAQKIGCSERSVIRAIQELFKAGLIIIEGKHTYKYKFSQYLLNLGGMVKIIDNAQDNLSDTQKTDDNLSGNTGQNVRQIDDNLSGAMIEPINEPTNGPLNVVEFKILKEYAKEHGATNIQGYINALKIKGVAADIIRQYREKEGVSKYWERQAAQTSEMIKQMREQKGDPMPESFKQLRKTLCKK